MISIIIVSYNVKYFIAQCLRSIYRASSDLDVEIFVVDNNSKDGSVEYLSGLFPEVYYISNKDNLGFGRANNMALAKARGEYVLFLNPDTVISERTLSDCLAFMKEHQDAGALGVRMLNSHGFFAPESRRSIPTPFVSFCKMSGLSRLFPKSRLFSKYHLSYVDNNIETMIQVVSGAFMFIRRSALDKVGGFDESFFMYGEDIDLSYRILKGGYSNWYLPTPIIHYKGESTTKTSYRYVKVFYDAMIIFFDKHYKHYSLLFSFLVKFVLSIKKIVSFLNNNLISRKNKMYGSENENFLFIGSAESIIKAKKIIMEYYPNGLHQFIVGDEKDMPNGHNSLDLMKPSYVVYDVDSFSYESILKAMSSSPKRNINLGTYNPTTDIIITEQEVLI